MSRRAPCSLAHIRPRVSAYAAGGPWFHTRGPGDSGPGGAESEGGLHFRSPHCECSDDKRLRSLRRGGDDFIAAVGAGESGPALRYAVRAVFAAGGAADASEDRFIPVLVASAGVLLTACQPFFPPPCPARLCPCLLAAGECLFDCAPFCPLAGASGPPFVDRTAAAGVKDGGERLRSPVYGWPLAVGQVPSVSLAAARRRVFLSRFFMTSRLRLRPLCARANLYVLASG